MHVYGHLTSPGGHLRSSEQPTDVGLFVGCLLLGREMTGQAGAVGVAVLSHLRLVVLLGLHGLLEGRLRWGGLKRRQETVKPPI